MIDNLNASAVPVPAAAWLFGSALAGLVAVRRNN
ncbi:MAG: VPLPA-CTERM sorting domain-containing protein [Cellvibrionales bacterium]|nr:VPLPA-CTERM sorting domain-containing protein [Cellvibrionales bacterium]